MADESGSSPSPAAAQPSTSPSRSGPESGSRKHNLLLVEDNLPDALLVRELIKIENLPLEIHTVRDGQRAIDFIVKAEEDAQAPPPDLVLLDLNLPRRHGFEVLQRLRSSEKFKHVPVLIVTSSDAAMDRQQATVLGASYFRKPPSYDAFLELSGVIRRLLEENGML